MATATKVQKKKPRAHPVRRPDILPLEQVANYPLAQQMLALAEAIEAEQGTRTTEEINVLIEKMRGSTSINVDLS
jgi:hypothetical protein